MPQVPYNPVPTAEPTSPGEKIAVNTPGAAFGENIGAALQHLGATGEQVGNELFTRAYALQELRNETEAREADANYAQQQGITYEKFRLKEGKDAVDGYPQFLSDSQDLRRQMRSSLSSPNAQRMFDSTSIGFMQRNIIGAAGHAASENKAYVMAGADAAATIKGGSVRQFPGDDKVYQDAVTAAQTAAETKIHIKGLEGSPAADLIRKLATSGVEAQRIRGINDTDPDRAATELEASKEDGKLDDLDYGKLQPEVRNQSRSIASVNIANQVLAEGRGDDTHPGQTIEQMQDRARTIAKERHPDDPEVAKNAVSNVTSLYRGMKYDDQQQYLADKKTVTEAMLRGVKTEQDIRAQPGMAQIIDRNPTLAKELPGMINNYNNARDKVTHEETFTRLKGMSEDPEGRLDFLNKDLTKEPLSQTDMRYLIAKQWELKDKQNADPRVGQALSILRGSMGAQLQALNIYSRKGNEDVYDHFTGALSSALDIWTETHGKPPTAKDIKDEIGPQVIQQSNRGRSLFHPFTGDVEPFFTQDMATKEAKDFTDKTKQEIMDRGGAEPTDEQMYKAYVRYQYLKLYGGAAKPKPKPGSDINE